MLTKKGRNIATLLLSAALIAAGCSAGGAGGDQGGTAGGDQNGTPGGNPNADKTITLAYVAWDTEIASTHVVEYVLENKLGYNVEMLQVDAGPMFAGVANGSADASVAAWLPGTHASYMEEYSGQIIDLGPNLEGAKIGMVVPAYMDITSIEDLASSDIGEALDYTVTGIEPGAGVMMATERALEAYGLSNWNILSSSSAAMAAQLLSAYEDEQPIIVTGWSPHWKFSKMELKYLEDPKGVYGEAENIHTFVRQGLEEDKPDAYQFLDQFYWSEEDMNAVMLAIQDGAEPADAAAEWVNANEEKVNAWLEGIHME